jgi:hypothetical protein
MILDTGTLIGITIALGGSITVMMLFWRENVMLTKRVRELQVALRDERRK